MQYYLDNTFSWFLHTFMSKWNNSYKAKYLRYHIRKLCVHTNYSISATVLHV